MIQVQSCRFNSVVLLASAFCRRHGDILNVRLLETGVPRVCPKRKLRQTYTSCQDVWQGVYTTKMATAIRMSKKQQVQIAKQPVNRLSVWRKGRRNREELPPRPKACSPANRKTTTLHLHPQVSQIQIFLDREQLSQKKTPNKRSPNKRSPECWPVVCKRMQQLPSIFGLIKITV